MKQYQEEWLTLAVGLAVVGAGVGLAVVGLAVVGLAVDGGGVGVGAGQLPPKETDVPLPTVLVWKVQVKWCGCKFVYIMIYKDKQQKKTSTYKHHQLKQHSYPKQLHTLLLRIHNRCHLQTNHWLWICTELLLGYSNFRSIVYQQPWMNPGASTEQACQLLRMYQRVPNLSPMGSCQSIH